VEWGSHTASHGFLDRVSDAEVSREIVSSKARLEALIGSTVRCLAYPNGYADARARRAAHEAGYVAALTTEGALLHPSASPVAWPRLNVGDQPAGMLRMEVTGALAALRKLRAA
jgi:peptidoglycan/xylan/chitin deacetylase (PgdA/CDA1 family)